jgi:Multiubiquitin
MAHSDVQAEGTHAAREVEIFVNKRPVRVPARTTGAAILAAAGVPDDQLFRVEGSREIPVGADKEIEVHEGERFVATPPIEPA